MEKADLTDKEIWDLFDVLDHGTDFEERKEVCEELLKMGYDSTLLYKYANDNSCYPGGPGHDFTKEAGGEIGENSCRVCRWKKSGF